MQTDFRSHLLILTCIPALFYQWKCTIPLYIHVQNDDRLVVICSHVPTPRIFHGWCLTAMVHWSQWRNSVRTWLWTKPTLSSLLFQMPSLLPLTPSYLPDGMQLSDLVVPVTVSPTTFIVTMAVARFTIHVFCSVSLNMSFTGIFLMIKLVLRFGWRRPQGSMSFPHNHRTRYK